MYDLENDDGTPIYVHSKVCIVDDLWMAVGSDNLNRRSWTHDSELSCAVIDTRLDDREPADPGGLGDGARVLARDTRIRLAAEHLGRGADDVASSSIRSRGSRRSAPGPTRSTPGTGSAAGRGRPGTCASTRRSGCGARAGGAAASPTRLLLDPDGRPRALRRRDEF